MNNIHQVTYKPDVDDKILDFESDDIIARLLGFLDWK